MRGRPTDARARNALVVAGVVLAFAGAACGLAVALGAWGVGYCGGLTPDVPPRGSLRSHLCRGTSGDVVGGVVLACWALAVAAPLAGLRLALRRCSAAPLVAAAACAAIPLAAIGVLSATLPQG
jgi:hypothetical protein